MQRVFVLDKNKKPLMPCLPVRARELLSKGKAKVYRFFPFTIILTERAGGNLQEIEFKADPGSKTTGFAVVAHFQRGYVVIWAANLEHRGQEIQESLKKRRAVRRNRRNRKTRYREPRFQNRRRKEGWLAPSVQSRVDNVVTWAKKLKRYAPLSQMVVETARFDTQKMQEPEISGIEYQQGELFGYEVREYLLEKWKRRCTYCDIEDVPLQVEHIVPRARRGTDRISNLTLSCKRCNQKKGTKDITEFLANEPERLKKILSQAKVSLKDATVVNAIRYVIGNLLKKIGLPVSFSSGGRTKYNRTRQGYAKDHWMDAACVGETGERVIIPRFLTPLPIKAGGRGSRQMCRVDQYGFPRTSAKSAKRLFGFTTGDMVKAIVPSGKKKGSYCGKIAVRASGYFNIQSTGKTVQGIHHKYCRILHHQDGYIYG